MNKFNFYKHTHLPRLVKNKLNKIDLRNPTINQPAPSYDRAGSLDMLEMFDNKRTRAPTPVYKGGDKIDRQDYMAEQKKRVGKNNLDRILAISARRTTHEHWQKDEMPYLEFNGMCRRQHISGCLKTHEWAWTAKDYIRVTAKYEAKNEAHIRAKWEDCYEKTKAHLEAEVEATEPKPDNRDELILEDLT